MRCGLLLYCAVVLLLISPTLATDISISASREQAEYYTSSNADWSTLHDASTSAAVVNGDGAQTVTVGIATNFNSGKFSDFHRASLAFDTRDIPLDQEITNVTLSIYIYGAGTEEGFPEEDDEVCIVYSYPLAYTAVTQDYARYGTKVYDSESLSSLDASPGWRDFHIDDDGIIKKGGWTYIGIRLRHDVEDDPYDWVSNKRNFLQFYHIASPNYLAKLNFSYNPNIPPTPTPTPYPGDISVNILEKYSNAALISQAITITPTAGGAGQTKTSLYGETLHFGVVPGMEYWFNASRAGYRDYNETYTIPASPGIYNVYMERILTPIANHSYAHFSVVDQTNGGLIPNAEIRLSDGQTKLTNSAGYTWFSVNNSEQINYYVSKPSGYWPAYGAMNLTADESILVALQRYTGPTATATMPGWTPVTVPTTGTGVDPVVTLSAQLRQQNVQEGMDVWYTNLPFISQFLFLLFIIGGLGLMAGGTRRN
jgi:hypothetical protein